MDHSYGDIEKIEQDSSPYSDIDKISKDSSSDDLGEALDPNLTSKIFYDAQTIGVSKDLDKFIYEGEVVAIGGGSIITADRIEVDKNSSIIQATGHIAILTPSQVFTGDSVVFQWVTGNFKIVNAMMLSFDADEVRRISDKVLGFTPSELEFEIERKKRLQYIASQKASLKEEYQKTAEYGTKPSKELVDRYALVLEREDLTEGQENAALSKMGKARRKIFLQRRIFWNKTRSEAKTPAISGHSFFKIEGDIITRTDGNDYKAFNAIWTPCKCDDDDSPAWGFHASKMEAQIGGYLDMYHPVLKIKDFPVLYLPYARFPIKSERQSGFLVPTIRTGDSDLGSVYTQPVFFDISPNFDSTLTTDLMQKRGTKLGLELRYKQREYSGWTVNVETIRDKVWMDERNTRTELLDYHLDPDHSYCHKLYEFDPVTDALNEEKLKQVAKCESDMRSQLAIPSNTWRGMQEWRGQSMLAPRVSIVSKGTLLSDHSYAEDLFMSNEFENAFKGQDHAVAFSTAKAKLHYDGKDAYLGIGSSVGDYVITENRFEGLQMPMYMNFQSRVINLDQNNTWPVPVYAGFTGDYISISNVTDDTADLEDGKDNIGEGKWQRGKLSIISPLYTKGIVRVDYFSEFEARYVTHKDLNTDKSTIRSWKTGLTLNLPLDGIGVIPSVFDFSKTASSEKRYLHHFMNWALTFSARPVVVRKGTYRNPTEYSGTLPAVYFGSDLDSSPKGDVAEDVDVMMKHQKITLETTHRWKTYKKVWKIDRGSTPVSSEEKKKITYKEKAMRELVYSLDRPVNHEKDIFKESDTGEIEKWYINRYKLADQDVIEPISLRSNISFDFMKEKERQDQIDRNRVLKEAGREGEVVSYENLPRSWDGPFFDLDLNLGGYTLSTEVDYDMYLRKSKEVDFKLGLPRFYQTALSFGYILEKQTDGSTGGEERIHTAEMSLQTSIIPYISSMSLNLVKKRFEEKPDEYGTSLSISYLDDSGCWGIDFSKTKDFSDSEKDASYLFKLSVIFLGQKRDLDMTPQLERPMHLESDD